MITGPPAYGEIEHSREGDIGSNKNADVQGRIDRDRFTLTMTWANSWLVSTKAHQGSGQALQGPPMMSDNLPFSRLWCAEPNSINNAIGYAKFRSQSHRAVIGVYDDSGNMIDTHELANDHRTRIVYSKVIARAMSAVASSSELSA